MAVARRRCFLSFPSELWTEILLRLPIRVLLRLRSTCTHFRNLIDSDSFGFLHFSRGMRSPESSKLIVVRRNNNMVIGNQYVKNAANDFLMSKEFIFPINLEQNFKCEAVGHVNGLILLHKYVCRAKNWNSASQLMVWNPFTHKSFTIPKSPLCSSGMMHNQPASIAFGYNGKDYKIVVLVVDCVSDETPEYRVRAEIFNLNTKCWSSGSFSCGTSCLILGPKVTCGNSILWLAGLPPDRMGRDNYDVEGEFVDDDNLEEDISFSCLFSVDLQNGYINTQDLPHPLYDPNEEPEIVRIPLIYNGYLSILMNGCQDALIFQFNGELWHELSDYEVDEELNDSLVYRRVTNAVLMDTNLGTFLLVSIHGGGMVSCQLEAGTTKRLIAGSDFVDLYVESLLSPSNPSGLT
ncbi:uncharacterized protein LOC141655872 [Silene latifolia]|uniref:uncharacterized protein LOC141655872 n=1 Tax=Silene latifolia TaxID=37657 RepID=UPI003D778209